MTESAYDRGRCSGHCCEQFSLPIGPEELEANYRRWLTDGEPIGMNNQHPRTYYQDIHLIYPMVRYLGFHDRDPPKVNPTNVGAVHWYTCKHFDPKSRDCTIYDIRPQMCRSYPGSAGCNYAECTWHEVKQKPLTPEEIERQSVVDPDQPIEKPTCAICGRNTANKLSYTCDCKKEVCSNCWSYGNMQCDQCVADLDPSPRSKDPPKLHLTCSHCRNVAPVTEVYRCACGAVACVECWDCDLEKCVPCASKRITCVACGDETERADPPRCTGGCDGPLCDNCWDFTNRLCPKCAKPKPEEQICAVCDGDFVTVDPPRCTGGCGGPVCAQCWDQKQSLCPKCAKPTPEEIMKKFDPGEIVRVCEVCTRSMSGLLSYRCLCEREVCSACWDGTKGQCVKCAPTAPDKAPAPLLTDTECSVCGTKLSIIQTYRCNCGELVCSNCWVEFQCVKCAAGGP